MAENPREIALRCLLAWERQGAWSDGYLHSAMGKAGLEGRDAGLCTKLTFGVVQNQMLLDWHISRLSSAPLEKLEPVIRNILRLGLYQLLFLDRIPVHAAVNESVFLAKKHAKNPRASGFVNAILRNFEREKAKGLPQPESLSIRYSHPHWLVRELEALLPKEELPRLLEADNSEPPVYAQVNTCRFTAREVAELLAEDGIEAKVHPWLPDCLVLEGTGNLERSQAFRSGAFYIQDPAARLAVLAAGARPGMWVLDACAAPGGKSFGTAIDMGDEGSILSCDVYPRKEKLIREGAARLGLNCISTALMDGRSREERWTDKFDLVIADVPCSGLGIIRKKPDIRYKAPEELKGLPKIQGDILENVAGYVKPGGVLLYATCTLLERENQRVVQGFLERRREFALESFELPKLGAVPEGQVTLWPHIHDTDGFFFAKLRRR